MSTPSAPGLLSQAEIDAVRRPYRAARLLPGRAYHDPAFYAFERERFFSRDWQMVAREEDVPTAGSYILATIDDEPLIVIRGRDEVVRAFYNVCQHRGTAVAEEPGGKVVRLQCPYHAWIYDLDGTLIRTKHTEDLAEFDFGSYGLRPVRLATWGGFLFVSLAADGPSLEEQLGDVVDHFARFDLTTLRSARSETYEVDANWKFIAENYSECYHCPSIHPQLNRLTPYDLGGDYNPEGQWQGGWMELASDAETMALAGGHRGGRPSMRGSTELDERRITYYLLWPNLFLSLHPDYLLVHRLTPAGPGHTRVECWWLFEPETIAAPGFDPSDAIGFWDLTNRQDWHVCELQQRGTASRSWVSGRYSTIEPSVHAFDLMVVDRYADDGISSSRTVRHRYDVPPDEDPVVIASVARAASAASVAGQPPADTAGLIVGIPGRETNARTVAGRR